MRVRVATCMVVVAALTQTALPATEGSKYVPSDAERARWTMSDMRSLATAIEAFASDKNNKQHSYPNAATIEALIPLIQPTFMKKAPTSDAWGHTYAYVPAADGQSYRLVSGGSDGKTDPASWGTPGPLTTFDQDAVLESGSLTRPWNFR
jgi:Type II secretion system (T2SS), protein G